MGISRQFRIWCTDTHTSKWVICCVDCIRFVYEMSTRCRLLLVCFAQPTQRNRIYMKLLLLTNFLKFPINCKHFTYLRHFMPTVTNLCANCQQAMPKYLKARKRSFVCLFVCLSVFWRDSPQWARASSFTRFLDHTQRRTTLGRTPLDEWLARHTDLYLTTHNTNDRKTSTPPVGFEPTISAGERP